MGYGTQGFGVVPLAPARGPEPALAHFRVHALCLGGAAPPQLPCGVLEDTAHAGLVADPLRQRTVDPLASQFHNRTAVSHQTADAVAHVGLPGLLSIDQTILYQPVDHCGDRLIVIPFVDQTVSQGTRWTIRRIQQA